jgi:hypothetical protein
VEPSDSPKDQQHQGSGGPQSPAAKKQSDTPPIPQTSSSTAIKQVKGFLRVGLTREKISLSHSLTGNNGLIDRVMITEICEFYGTLLGNERRKKHKNIKGLNLKGTLGFEKVGIYGSFPVKMDFKTLT